MMSISKNKEHTHTKQNQTLLPAGQQQNMDKALMKLEDPFIAEAMKCCV